MSCGVNEVSEGPFHAVALWYMQGLPEHCRGNWSQSNEWPPRAPGCKGVKEGVFVQGVRDEPQGLDVVCWSGAENIEA